MESYTREKDVIGPKDPNVYHVDTESIMGVIDVRTFKNADEAAIHFIQENNSLTHKDNRERGSYIYEATIDGKTKYFYFESRAGGHDNVIFNAIFHYNKGSYFENKNWNADVDNVVCKAFVHTHPKCPGHDGENFSDPDIILGKLPGISEIYLGTPTGMLHAYDGNTNTQRQVSSSMPVCTHPFTDCKTQ